MREQKAIQQAKFCVADMGLTINVDMTQHLILKPTDGTLRPRQREELVRTLCEIKIILGEDVSSHQGFVAA